MWGIKDKKKEILNFRESKFISRSDDKLKLWPDFMVGQKGSPVKVLIADSDVHIRNIIKRELDSDPRIHVVAETKSVKEARKIMKANFFDILLTDLSFEDGSGFDIIIGQKYIRPSAQAIVISVVDTDENLSKAIQLGVSGFILKNSWFGNYVQAVLQVANGGASFSPNLVKRLLVKINEKSGDYQSNESFCEALSDREIEVLRNIVHGYTSQEIALKLNIALLTVNTHVRNIYKKLQVKSRAQAVNVALSRKLV